MISSATLMAALIFIFGGISLEAYLGAVISVIIIKAGFDMLSETVSKLLGEPGDYELFQNIKETVASFPEVRGVYDLVLNNYGPDTYNGSVHIELDDDYPKYKLDELTRDIAVEVFKRNRVILTAVGIYLVNTQDKEIVNLRNEISRKVLANKYVRQIHAFHYNTEKKTVRFDVVISFDLTLDTDYGELSGY